MTIEFVIPRAPVSVNEMYVNSFNATGKGRYLSSVARDFKESAAAHALVAARVAGWPRPLAAKAVRLVLVAWNTRHDVDAPCKAAMDAFEGILYVNDRAVVEVTCRKAKDSGSKRVEVLAELLER